jgi:hypothetical protein
MSRNRTAILVNRTVEVSVLPSSPRCACSSSRGPNAAGLRIALTCRRDDPSTHRANGLGGHARNGSGDHLPGVWV